MFKISKIMSVVKPAPPHDNTAQHDTQTELVTTRQCTRHSMSGIISLCYNFSTSLTFFWDFCNKLTYIMEKKS